MTPKTVGLIVFEQMAADELTGPAEVFSRARIQNGNGGGSSGYHVLTLGVGAAPCVTECGITVTPQLTLADAPQLDTVIIPGSSNVLDAKLIKKIAQWLRRRVPGTRRVATLGSGIYALASTGLLDERHVTTHWRLARDVALRFPKLRIAPNCLFVKDDRFYTCAGGTSAIDFSLSLIEEDYGRQVALSLARELVVQLKRSGEQEQYSDALQFQVQSCDRFTDIATWILCNLNADLSVEALAHRACMSLRNFTRLFKAAFGKAPAEFVAHARITEARRLLAAPRNSIESIATSIGFQSADAFSRAFEREVGCRPSEYRARLRITPRDGFHMQRSRNLELVLADA